MIVAVATKVEASRPNQTFFILLMVWIPPWLPEKGPAACAHLETHLVASSSCRRRVHCWLSSTRRSSLMMHSPSRKMADGGLTTCRSCTDGCAEARRESAVVETGTTPSSRNCYLRESHSSHPSLVRNAPWRYCPLGQRARVGRGMDRSAIALGVEAVRRAARFWRGGRIKF
ncbi:hypothetical protein D9M72_402660 [compost metagenome]